MAASPEADRVVPTQRSPVPLAYDVRAIEKRVGLILLATDHTSEADFVRLVASPRLGIFATRIAYANPVTPQNLSAMRPGLSAAAGLILPDEALDAICFSCSSASVVIGDAAVEAAIHAAKPGVPVVTPAAAAVDALRALGARRISVLTPYTHETSAPMAIYFERAGFALDRFTCLGLEDDREMARLSAETLLMAATQALAPQSDALFVSCTALRAAALVPELERRLDRPVVTSNQASAWACLAHCGLPSPENAGRLMRVPMRRPG